MSRPTSHATVAVMQPYFFPYAGYFRLLAAADVFVVFDCVQFPRRGRVHRTEVPAPNGGVEWLTLPLARQPQSVLIRDLEFARDARACFDERLSRHRWIASGTGPAADRVRAFLYGALDRPADFLTRGVRLIADLLDIDVQIVQSSELDLDPGYRGQERVIATAAALGATRYVNAPGGRALYDRGRFERAGIALSFLPPYSGRFTQLLPGLLHERPATIRRDVCRSDQ